MMYQIIKKIFYKKNKGFTLIELMVAMTISGIAISSIYILVQRLILANVAYIDNRANSRYIIDILQRDLQAAINVEGSRTYNAVGYQANQNDLILKVPSIDASGNVIDVDNDFDYIIYRSQNNSLTRIIDAKLGVSARGDQAKTICRNLGFISYTQNGTNLIMVNDPSSINELNITLQINRTFSAGMAPTQKTETIMTQVKLRNKVI